MPDLTGRAANGQTAHVRITRRGRQVDLPRWPAQHQRQTAYGNQGEGGNCEGCDPCSEPQLEHWNVVSSSTLKDSQRTALGEEQCGSFSDENDNGQPQPGIPTSTDRAEPHIAQTSQFAYADCAVRRSEHSGFAAQCRSADHKSRSSHKTGEPAKQERDRATQSRGTRVHRCPGASVR
jgi:hypothetical protein